MNKNRGILLVILLTVCMFCGADVFIDDCYYYPNLQVKNGTQYQPHRQTATTVQPHYNKNVQEIIFIDEDTTKLHPDTVRAIIRR